MRGYRFYLEFDKPIKKRRGEHTGNVLALILEQNSRGRWEERIHPGTYHRECIAAVYLHANSPVSLDAVALSVLRRLYKRIPESRAREIHPAMFEYLEYLEREEDSYNPEDEE